MARPTKYNADMLAKAKEYLVNYDQYDHAIPSEAGLSDVLDVCRDTINEWSKHDDKKEFSDTLRKIKNKQELVAVNKGIKGDFNPAITKLILHNHGYSDKQQVEQSGVTVVKIKGEF
jgi:hypothetical protein